MIKVLNANKTKQIISYLQNNAKDIYYPEKIEYIMNEEFLTVRNLIFSQYILPITEIINDEIVKIVLFDMRYFSDKSKNIIIMCGNYDKKFLNDTIQKIKLFDEKGAIKKMTIKGEFNDIKPKIEFIKGENFKTELEIPIGNSGFMQLSLFLNER